jgi:cytoskeleton protein RodZ
MVEDFGSYLKAERELRGVTLEELHAKTKIPIHFLQALEKNKFEELPEQVFIKGYIRSFAKVIGANEDEVLSTYIDITKTASSTDIKSQSIPKQNNYNFDPKFIFILIFIILFLSGAIWSINTLIRNFNTESKKISPSVSQQKKNKIKEKLQNSPVAKEPENNEAPRDLTTSKLSEKSSEINAKISIKIPSKNTTITTNDDDTSEKLKTLASITTKIDMPLKLIVKVKSDVSLNIAIDGSPLEDFILSQGSEKIFYGKNQYLLGVDNQNSVDLTLNGIKLNFPNKNSVVKNFIITSKLVE